MFSVSLLATVLLASSSCLATIFVTNPVASTSAPSGALNITWINDQSAPLGSLFGPTTLGLYVGSITTQTLIQDLGTVADPIAITFLAANVLPASGPNYANYFIRFQSVSAVTLAGVPLQAFSARFSLTGMTGVFSAAVAAQVSAASAATALPTTAVALPSSTTVVKVTSTITPTSALPTAAPNSASSAAAALATTSTKSNGKVGVQVKGASLALAFVASVVCLAL